MRFHAILFVRDESDVIAECLQHNSQWCDHIYVFDTGSTDGTWEVVNECARALPQVVPVRRESIWFHDGLRAMIFEEFRNRSDEGDWWVRLDADEFYHVPPPQFVKALAPYESAIYHAYYNFKLTIEEATTLNDESRILAERERPIQLRRRHYIPGFDYSEPRLFRYRKSMRWSPNAFGPHNAGYLARKRIPIRHYPHRDPLQLEGRYRLRRAMLERMAGMYGPHSWDVSDWRTELVPISDPRLKLWDPSTEALPECMMTNHLASPLKRIVQWCVHRSVVPILDCTRPRYPIDFRPESFEPSTSGR